MSGPQARRMAESVKSSPCEAGGDYDRAQTFWAASAPTLRELGRFAVGVTLPSTRNLDNGTGFNNYFDGFTYGNSIFFAVSRYGPALSCAGWCLDFGQHHSHQLFRREDGSGADEAAAAGLLTVQLMIFGPFV